MPVSTRITSPIVRLGINIADVFVAADRADVNFLASGVDFGRLVLFENLVDNFAVVLFLFSENFHLVSRLGKARRANFVSQRLNLVFAGVLGFLDSFEQRQKIFRVLAVERGVETGVCSLLVSRRH